MRVKTKMASIPACELELLRAEAAEGRLARLILLDLARRQGGPVSFTFDVAEVLAAESVRMETLQALSANMPARVRASRASY